MCPPPRSSPLGWAEDRTWLELKTGARQLLQEVWLREKKEERQGYREEAFVPSERMALLCFRATWPLDSSEWDRRSSAHHTSGKSAEQQCNEGSSVSTVTGLFLWDRGSVKHFKI